MKKIHEKLMKVFESKVLTRVLIIVGIVIIFLLTFSAGVSVGFHKASFGRAWGDNYERNFGMKPNFPGPGFGRDNLPNAHGAVGKIIKIEMPSIIVQGKDNIERVVLIGVDTKVEKMRENISVNDLKLDDFVVVIGAPNDQGQILAKFIRLMPAPDFLNNNLPINPPQENEKLPQ